MGPQPDFLDTRGVIHLGLNQTKEAITDLEAAAKTAPSPSKLFHLAQAYYQINDKEKAKQFLREAKAKGLDRQSRRSGWPSPPRTARLSRNCSTNWGFDPQPARTKPPVAPNQRSCLPDHGLEVLSIVVGNLGGELLDLLGRDKPHAVGDLLDAGDLQSLA